MLSSSKRSTSSLQWISPPSIFCLVRIWLGVISCILPCSALVLMQYHPTLILFAMLRASTVHLCFHSSIVSSSVTAFLVSSKYGFGLMDAGLMTWYASGWTNVPSMSTCQSSTLTPKKKIEAYRTEAFTIDLTECQNRSDGVNEVNYIEQVQVFVTLTTKRRGDMEIYVYSPSKTKTQILPVSERSAFRSSSNAWTVLETKQWSIRPRLPRLGVLDSAALGWKTSRTMESRN